MQSDEVKNQRSGDVLELDEAFIVLGIPDDTLEIDITAKVYIDHEMMEVTKHMDFSEVRAAIREASEGYIPSDQLFMLAPTRQEKIQQLVESALPEDE